MNEEEEFAYQSDPDDQFSQEGHNNNNMSFKPPKSKTYPETLSVSPVAKSATNVHNVATLPSSIIINDKESTL